MLPHHQQALDAYVAKQAAEPDVEAVLLTGSVAQGRARPDSDLDVYVVLADEAHRQRWAADALGTLEACDYPGGYVDVKYVSRALLEDAVGHGTEPFRASFVGARVVHERGSGLAELAAAIGTYPETSRTQSIRDLLAQVVIHAGYFLPQALDRDDPFLTAHAASSTALFGGRVMLAHNRELFPCAKQLISSLERCAELPEGFVERTKALCAAPSKEAATDYLMAVATFQDWGLPMEEVLSVFMKVDEWAWHDPSRSAVTST
jgi:hypothetical protein